MKFKTILMGLVLATITSAALGASTVTIDGSSSQTTATTLQAMRDGLSPSENCQLTIAITRIKLGDEKQAAKDSKSAKAPEEPLGPLLNGMTYSEIIKLAQTYPGMVRSTCEQ